MILFLSFSFFFSFPVVEMVKYHTGDVGIVFVKVGVFYSMDCLYYDIACGDGNEGLGLSKS